MPPLNLQDAGQIRDLIVNPIAERVEAKMEEAHRVLVDRLNDHDERMASMRSELNSFRKELDVERGFRVKVAVVYGFVTLLVGAAWGQLKEKVVTRFSGGGH